MSASVPLCNACLDQGFSISEAGYSLHTLTDCAEHPAHLLGRLKDCYITILALTIFQLGFSISPVRIALAPLVASIEGKLQQQDGHEVAGHVRDLSGFIPLCCSAQGSRW